MKKKQGQRRKAVGFLYRYGVYDIKYGEISAKAHRSEDQGQAKLWAEKLAKRIGYYEGEYKIVRLYTNGDPKNEIMK